MYYLEVENTMVNHNRIYCFTNFSPCTSLDLRLDLDHNWISNYRVHNTSRHGDLFSH